MTAGWEGLVADAVLGTERRPYTAPVVGGDLADVVAAAGDVLGAASAIWAYETVGRRPAKLRQPVAPQPAPPDDRPLLPQGALRSLSAIVGEAHLRPLLAEWLQLAAADGRRLPPEWLPMLLDLSPAERRAELESAGGPRCGWLAAQRPDWAAAGTSPRVASLARAVLDGLQVEWDAPDEDRLAAFGAVRRADPLAARRLAERVWPGEPPVTRAAIVVRMADGLTMADEPFLEQRLDDRRKEVRLAAAALLTRLPQSRYAARMAARSRAAVRLRGRARPSVTVEPPPEIDPTDRRDSITATSAHPEQWALQVVGATPLDTWSDADRLVDAAVRSGAGYLVAAWALAAERQANPEWARRLLAAGTPPTAGLLSTLPSTEAQSVVLDRLRRAHLGESVDVLSALPGPWPAAVTDAVMVALGGLVRSGDQSPPAAAVRDALPRFALLADPRRAGTVAAVAGDIERLPDDRRPGARLFWGRAVTSLNALVHFRQAMHQEFRPR